MLYIRVCMYIIYLSDCDYAKMFNLQALLMTCSMHIYIFMSHTNRTTKTTILKTCLAILS